MKKLMQNKLIQTLATLCALSPVCMTPLTAFAQSQPASQFYYQGHPVDGSPIRANSCGINFGKRGWITRDLEGGARGEVGITDEAENSLSVTLLFRFSQQPHANFEIIPEEIKLYAHPSGRLVKPSSIERKPFASSNSTCDILQQGEWLTLKFPVQAVQSEQIALLFPKGSIANEAPLDVRPFRFERMDLSSNGTPTPSRPPINAPSVPPLSPRFGAFESASAMPMHVKGTWILDAKATEELITRGPRPVNAQKLAQWFALAGGYAALYTYEFEGNTAKVSAYRGNQALQFERRSNQDTETIYAPVDAANPKSQTLSVSMLQNGNLRIIPSSNPEMAYLRWKPGQLKTESAKPNEVMEVARVWMASSQAIAAALAAPIASPKTPSKGSVKTGTDPQAALEDAVRIGVIRKATAEDIKGFRDAYIEKKYISRNRPVPAGENALSVSNVDTSRAYVVLKPFAYPAGMTDGNRVVFFIPKGVPEPSGAIGHSAAYDLETLTVTCTAARTGGMDC